MQQQQQEILLRHIIVTPQQAAAAAAQRQVLIVRTLATTTNTFFRRDQHYCRDTTNKWKNSMILQQPQFHPHPKLINRRGFADAAATHTKEDESESPVNFFHVLGLEHSTFKIDADEMKQKYRKLMAQFHPDKQKHQEQQEEDELHDRASLITLAYDTLKDPHTRAIHLLELHGQPLKEGENELVCKAFLMSVMDLREEIDEAPRRNDTVLGLFLTENNQRVLKTCKELEDALDHHDPPQLDRARQLTAQLQYWNRIHETIREKMDT